MKKMNELTQHLETTLGPDTGDLSMRIGLHSGPVTAGVLRGEKSRFQLYVRSVAWSVAFVRQIMVKTTPGFSRYKSILLINSVLISFLRFGDTVNTAARIEATGQSNRIHMSQDTANLLVNSGKGHWLKQRDNTISPKGKGMQSCALHTLHNHGKNRLILTILSFSGEMQTFWLESDDQNQEENAAKTETPTSSEHESVSGNDESAVESDGGFGKIDMEELGIDSDDFDERTQSLVSWNADLLLKILRQIVARRVAVAARNKETGAEIDDHNDPVLWPKSGMSPIEEVNEIIHLPEFDGFVARHEPDPETVEIDDEVIGQLNDFVRIIASMYRQNAFHNFEHASHVAMSVNKLLSRIVAPTTPILGESSHHATKDKSTLHDHTCKYGPMFPRVILDCL